MNTNLIKKSKNSDSESSDAISSISWTYQAVFENLKDGCVVYELTTEKILALNRTARTLLGYTQSEATALALNNIHPPIVHEQYKTALSQIATAGEACFETLYKRKDGSTFPVEVAASYFEVDGQQIVQAVARDITARRQAEKNLQQQIEKERLIHSLELKMGIAKEKLIHAIALRIRESLDLQTCLQTTADEVFQFLRVDRVLIYKFNTDGSGYVPVEAVGSNWTSVLRQTITDPCLSDNYSEIFSQGEPRVVPDIYRASYSSKQRLFLEQLQVKAKIIVPIFQEDQLWGLMMVHQCSSPRAWKDSEVDLLQKLATQVDIAIRQADLHQQTRTELAERKRIAEELEQARDEALTATKMKSEFLAMMSHEIRTPMNGVIGMTNLLLETQLCAEQQRYVETLRSCGSALLSLINDILDMSKIEFNKLELDSEPFSLKQCVDSAIALLQPEADEKQIYLNCHIAPTVPTNVIGDAARLRQILINLLGNAIKFTNVGSVMLSIKSIAQSENSESNISQPESASPSQFDRYKLTFSIKDTGIGIPSTRIDRLFSPFTQVDSSISREYGGTGLGLAISQRLCELMGGRIWVESQIGKGSCFSFTIPMWGSEQKATSVENVGKVSPLNRQLRLAQRLPLEILVAEDNLVNQQLVKQWLKKLGYQATLVSNGQEVLEKLQQQAYDLILMDVQMPKMDGISATKQICQRWSADERPKIIAMTANAMKGDRKICLDAGMDAYLSKPVQLQDLVTAIEQCCASSYSSSYSSEDPTIDLSSTVSSTVSSTASSTTSPAISLPTYPAAFTSTRSSTLLDSQRLAATAKSLGGLTQGWLYPFIGLYVDQGTELLAQLSEASWHQDYDTVIYAAHTLRASSAALGLIAVSEGCQQIENYGKQKRAKSTTALINQSVSQLKAIFHLSVEALRQFAESI